MKQFDLPAIGDARKTFYGKAVVTEFDNGDIELTSFKTIVCRIHNKRIQKLWNGYSATTMRHINAFLKFYDMDGGGKTWWNNLELA